MAITVELPHSVPAAGNIRTIASVWAARCLSCDTRHFSQARDEPHFIVELVRSGWSLGNSDRIFGGTWTCPRCTAQREAPPA